MIIGAIAPWFGGKRMLASHIVPELGAHNYYLEPFCGSLAVLFAKRPCISEIVNDLNGDLVNLARVLADDVQAPKLYAKLKRTLACKSLFADATGRMKEWVGKPAEQAGNLSRAADYMFVTWCGMTGFAGTDSETDTFSVRWSSRGQQCADRFASAVDSIPDWHKRLRNVVILNECAFALLRKTDLKESAVIYADPPYVEKSCEYLYDFGKPCEACNGVVHTHEELASVLHSLPKARIVLSYYDHPILHTLYADWTWRRFGQSKGTSHNTRDVRKPRAVECLILSKPSLARKTLLSAMG